MNIKLSNIFSNTGKYLKKHEPELLVGIGIAGMISTVILAVKATPKALELIELEKKYPSRKGETLSEAIKTKSITRKEIIKAGWRPYLYPSLLGIASITCIIGGTTINTKRNAALTTAYAITENAFTTYKNKVIETIGEKRERNLQGKIAEDGVKNNPPVNNQVIITSRGNTLCKDSISERYFKSDIDTIRKVINELNRKMTIENYISLEEFYYELGLKPMKHADRLGWEIDDGLLEVYFDTCLADNDEPCIVLNYNIYPKYGYDKLA